MPDFFQDNVAWQGCEGIHLLIATGSACRSQILGQDRMCSQYKKPVPTAFQYNPQARQSLMQSSSMWTAHLLSS